MIQRFMFLAKRKGKFKGIRFTFLSKQKPNKIYESSFQDIEHYAMKGSYSFYYMNK